MNDKKQFTFEDWKTGKIYKALKDQSIEGFDYSIIEDVGWFPTNLYENGYMEVEELRKIDEAQKDSFFKAVENNVKYKLEAIKNAFGSAPKPKQLLDSYIESINSGIETFPEKYKQKVFSGDWSRLMIDYSIFMRLNDERLPVGKSEILFTNNYKVPDRLEREHTRTFKNDVPKNDNNLIRLTVAYRLLDEIEKLLGKNPDFPESDEIAKLFSYQSKNTESDYTLDDYAFVMKYARDNHLQSNVSQLIRDIKADKKCPPLVKNNEDEKAIRNWIKFYDQKAGIERKKHSKK